MFFGDIVYLTYDVVQKTYDVVYEIVYDIVHQNGKNLYFNVRYRTSNVGYRIRYRIRYMHEHMFFSSHRNISLSLQALFHPYLLKTAMTRIVHGIRMMKGIMLTSSLHHIAFKFMAHFPGSLDPLARFQATVPDWSVLVKVALDNAIRGLPVPVVGPAPPEISCTTQSR